MGDIPSGRLGVSTDLIFRPALEDENIRDEVYCQIMKQLTENKVQISVERGWDLMWLATGIMTPTSVLLRELMEFLRTRTYPIAAECLKRLKKTLNVGKRKHPPHIIEVEAIQKRIMQIFHKVSNCLCERIVTAEVLSSKSHYPRKKKQNVLIHYNRRSETFFCTRYA